MADELARKCVLFQVGLCVCVCVCCLLQHASLRAMYAERNWIEDWRLFGLELGGLVGIDWWFDGGMG